MGQPPSRERVKLAATPRFQRRTKKLTPEERRALARALRLFERDPHDPRLGTPKLQGEHANAWAFSFGFDARVVFEWEGRTAVLLDVGSHDEVYG